MSKDTNLRYELPSKPSKLFQQYTESVKINQILAEKGNDEKVLDRKALHDEWLERSDVKLKARALKNDKKLLGHELKMVAKANLLVRKRALELRLEADEKIYTEELARFGKSFHKERV